MFCPTEKIINKTGAAGGLALLKGVEIALLWMCGQAVPAKALAELPAFFCRLSCSAAIVTARSLIALAFDLCCQLTDLLDQMLHDYAL